MSSSIPPSQHTPPSRSQASQIQPSQNNRAVRIHQRPHLSFKGSSKRGPTQARKQQNYVQVAARGAVLRKARLEDKLVANKNAICRARRLPRALKEAPREARDRPKSSRIRCSLQLEAQSHAKRMLRASFSVPSAKHH